MGCRRAAPPLTEPGRRRHLTAHALQLSNDTRQAVIFRLRICAPCRPGRRCHARCGGGGERASRAAAQYGPARHHTLPSQLGPWGFRLASSMLQHQCHAHSTGASWGRRGSMELRLSGAAGRAGNCAVGAALHCSLSPPPYSPRHCCSACWTCCGRTACTSCRQAPPFCSPPAHGSLQCRRVCSSIILLQHHPCPWVRWNAPMHIRCCPQLSRRGASCAAAEWSWCSSSKRAGTERWSRPGSRADGRV